MVRQSTEMYVRLEVHGCLPSQCVTGTSKRCVKFEVTASSIEKIQG